MLLNFGKFQKILNIHCLKEANVKLPINFFLETSDEDPQVF